ncbi:tyrosine-type recombinase/integrase [Candidatus Parcubacteria bacterium]|nr:tyrosine-type recombinase/integrase [Candidatus Parcubacteria bacterium]
MNTQTNNKKTTRIERDPIYNLERELKIRGFSRKTVKSYLHYNKELLKFNNKSPKNINSDDIKEYLFYLKNKKLANATLNVAINAIKFYYAQILKRKFFVNKEIFRTKKAQKLPEVLNKEEIGKIFSVIKNAKHKLILGLIYSSGLRVSEIINVKQGDLDFENKILKVKQSKGAKDRITILSEKIAVVLEKYIKNKKAGNYIFESARGGKLSERTIQKIFENALKNSGVKKSATCHSLRHSFATHLLESGISIRCIQELLGHARLETTQIYTKVANNKLKEIKSPLD